MIDLDEIKTASYKGVEFEVEEVEFSFGRQIITYRYPKSSRADLEDMGIVPEKFTVRGFVCEDDNMAEKGSKLITVLSEEGAGVLVDPFFYPIYGDILVRSGEIKVRNRNTEHGISRFEIDFYREYKDKEPKIRIIQKSKKSSLLDYAKDSFLGLHDVLKVPVRYINDFRKEFEELTRGVRDAVRVASATATEIGNIEIALAQLENSIDQVVSSPSRAAKLIEDSLQILDDSLDHDVKRLEALKNIILSNDNNLIQVTSRIELNEQIRNVRRFKKFVSLSIIENIALKHRDSVDESSENNILLVTDTVKISNAVVDMYRDIGPEFVNLIEKTSTAYKIIEQLLYIKKVFDEVVKKSLEYVEGHNQVIRVLGVTNKLIMDHLYAFPSDSLQNHDPFIIELGDIEVVV